MNRLNPRIREQVDKFTNKTSLLFLTKTIFKSALGLRNLKTLFYRFCTIFVVIAHYMIVENIDYDKWVHNEIDFVSFIVVWHFIFMNFKAIEDSRRKANIQ